MPTENLREQQQSLIEFVTRHEFNKLESMVQEQATNVAQQASNIIELTAVVEQSSQNLNSLIQTLGTIRDQQSGLASHVAEIRATLEEEKKPKGISPGLLISALAAFMTMLSLGGVLVYQHVSGVAQPLNAAVADIRQQISEHTGDGHSYKAQTQIAELSARFDDYRSYQKLLSDQQVRADAERQDLLRRIQQAMVDNLQMQLRLYEDRLSGHDTTWAQDRDRLREDLDKLRQLLNRQAVDSVIPAVPAK